MSIRNSLLALLNEGPRYGFQLKKEFEEYTANFWPLNIGQVYTTISRLIRDGLVEEQDEDAQGANQEQRLYRLTDEGTAELTDWFRQPRESTKFERDELTIKVAMAVSTNQPGVREMIHAQRIEATAAIQELTRRKARASTKDISGSIVIDAAIARVDSEIRWLDLAEARINSTRPDGPRASVNEVRSERKS